MDRGRRQVHPGGRALPETPALGREVGAGREAPRPRGRRVQSLRLLGVSLQLEEVLSADARAHFTACVDRYYGAPRRLERPGMMDLFAAVCEGAPNDSITEALARCADRSSYLPTPAEFRRVLQDILAGPGRRAPDTPANRNPPPPGARARCPRPPRLPPPPAEFRRVLQDVLAGTGQRAADIAEKREDCP